MANPNSIQYKTLKKIFSTTDEIQQGKTINEWHVSQMIDALTGLDNYDVKVKGQFNIDGRFYFNPPSTDNINDNNVRLLVADVNNRVFYKSMSQINNIFPLEINPNNRTAWNHGMGGVTSNTSFGYSTYINNTIGYNNTSYGSYNLVNNTTGNNNNIYGTQNMPYSKNANNNFLFSIQGLFNNISGDFNIGVGLQPLYNNINGDGNIGIGNYSLFENTSGNNNIGIGTLTLTSNRGNGNIAIGNESSRYDMNGNNRVTIGNYSGKNLGSDWLEIHSYDDPFDDSPALILGNFREKWVKINGNFQINIAHFPPINLDSTANNQIFFNDRGESFLGDRSYTISEINNLLSNYLTLNALNNYYTKSEVDTKFINGTSESLTTIQQPTLEGNVLTIKYVGENQSLQAQSVDLSPITSDPTLQEYITANITVGGINVNDVLPPSTTFPQFVKKLIQKTFMPTFVAPSLTLSNNAGTREIGEIINLTLTSNFSRGEIRVNGVFQDYRSGTGIITTDEIVGNIKTINNYIVLSTNSFNSSVIYNDGPIPKDSAGVSYPAQQLLSGSLSANTTFIGRLRTFAGMVTSPPSIGSEIRTLLLSSSILNAGNAFSITTDGVKKTLLVAVPSNKNVTKAVNTTTNEELTLTLSSINTIPDASGNNQSYKTYLLTTAVAFSNGQIINITTT